MAVWFFASVSAFAAEDSPFSLGTHASTLGLGVAAGYDLSDSFSTRALFSRFDYSFDRTKRGKRFDGALELQSLGLMADWHPLGGGFRVTGGAFINSNELAVGAKSDELRIGTRSYDGNLDINVDFESLAPYLGVGWSGGRGRTGLGFVFDAGLLFQGSPDLSGSGSVGPCRFTVDEGGRAQLTGSCAATLKADLEEEYDKLKDDLDDFKLYPVVLFGVSYRF